MPMWPFSLLQKIIESRTGIRKIDDRFSTSGQIRPEQIKNLAEHGFVAIVCARPDNEGAGQPTFADIAREAKKHGLKAVHIPVSGAPTPEQIARFGDAMRRFDGPVLGYCRSGMRSANLYAALTRKP